MHRSAPRRDVGIVALAADHAVTAERVDVVRRRILLARRDVEVRAPPRVARDRLAQIRPTPVARSIARRRRGPERVEPLRARRKDIAVEAVRVERECEDFDLTLRGTYLSVADIPKHRRRDHRCQRRDDCDYDEQLDEREATRNAATTIVRHLSLIHISEPTRRTPISYA